jgi:hypothetical protein
MRMISEDFITDIPTEINALARIARIVTLNAMQLANRIWLMKNRKWRPGTRLKKDGKEKNRCGRMKH